MLRFCHNCVCALQAVTRTRRNAHDCYAAVSGYHAIPLSNGLLTD
jgi:hypothetical protein